MEVIEVAAAIIMKQDLVLSARRKSGIHLAGFWEFPGGKVEKGESPEECLKRELSEEFEINAEIGSFVGQNSHIDGKRIINLMAYRVDNYLGELRLNDHDEIRWLALDKLFDVKWAPADIPLVKIYRSMATTAKFYEENAQAYCNETASLDMKKFIFDFTSYLPKAAKILDLGCGSGRDSRIFKELGFSVTAMDASPEIASSAEQYIEQPVLVGTFQSMTFKNEFHGIWACASLLHCPKAQMRDALSRVENALKVEGVLFLSFKWGDDETEDSKGRFFNNYTDKSLSALITESTDLEILNLWSNSHILRGQPQKWVNAILRK